MGLFKKKEKIEETKMEKTYLANMENGGFFCLLSNKFYGKFDEEQKKALTYAIEHKLPYEAYAYEELPAKYMNFINQYADCMCYGKFQPVDIWKLVNAGLDYPQFEIAMLGLTEGLKFVDEIPILRIYDAEVLGMVYKIYRYTHKNYCKMISPDMDKDAFMKKCNKIIQKIDKENQEGLKMEKYIKPF